MIALLMLVVLLGPLLFWGVFDEGALLRSVQYLLQLRDYHARAGHTWCPVRTVAITLHLLTNGAS